MPFRAVRPAADRVSRVVTRSYEDYSLRERKALLADNRESFLHILNPGYRSHRKFRGAERYRHVRQRYLEFLEQGVLIRDREPAFYLYRNGQGGHTAWGVLGAMEISDYALGRVKRHEDTIRRREERFADFLEGARFNAEPVLIAYPDAPRLEDLLQRIMQGPPDTDFTDDRGVRHELWAVTGTQEIRAIREAFAEIPQTYIMDGHHRSASSVLYASRREAATPGVGQENAPHHYFLSCLIPESQVRIRSFSRLLTDLGGLATREILDKLHVFYQVDDLGESAWEPEEKHQFTMYLDGRFYRLALREDTFHLAGPVSRLDSRILSETVLRPVFGISDPRHDARLHYRCGPEPVREIQEAVDRGHFAVGFGMRPVDLAEIRAVADAGLTMPPKSTFIEPKLPSGLTIYDL